MAPTVEQASRTDAGLASELRMSVMRLRRRLVGERDPDNELSLGQMAVLGALLPVRRVRHRPARRRGSGCSPPSMTRTVSCLEEDGYVVRQQDAEDKRRSLVALTDLGRERLTSDRRKRDAWLALRLKDLTPDERDVLRQAAPILARLAEAE